MGCGTGVVVMLIIAIVVVFILASSFGGLLGGSSSSGGGDVIASTVEREALPAGSINETDFYEDHVGAIENQTVFLSGLKHFRDKTGIQPYVYLTNTTGDYDSLESFTEAQYDQISSDEAHFLVVFLFSGEEITQYYYQPGDMAKSIMDQEACDIFEGYMSRYYSDYSLSYDEFFSKSFSDTADRIMNVTTSPWIYVLIVLGVLLILVLLFVWWRKAKKQKNLEAKQTEEILDTPLEKFGDTEAEELGKKYDDDPDNDPKT